MRKRLGAVLYNLDRTIASAIWGTLQETISSEVGRIVLGANKPDGWTPRYQLRFAGRRLWRSGWTRLREYGEWTIRGKLFSTPIC